MTIDEILARFRAFDGYFPEDAFKEAVAQREAITPALLGLLSKAADDPGAAAEDPDDLALTYALFLLAEFREPRAFRPCIALASLPGEQAFELLSELIDDSLDRILVSVFDGDTAPLVALAANGRAEEGIRAAAVRTVVALARLGRIPREECARCLRELMNGKIPDTAAWVWDELVLGVIDLPAPELRDEADHAVQEGFTSEEYEDLDELEEAVKRMPADPPEPIESAAAELRSWYCFTAEGRAEMESESDAAEGDWEPAPDAPAPVPYVAPPTPGRNDPCPCGSGKKYKKCCGA